MGKRGVCVCVSRPRVLARLCSGNGWSPSPVPLEVESHLVSVPHWPHAERRLSECLSSPVSWTFSSCTSLAILKWSVLISRWTSSRLKSRPNLNGSSGFMCFTATVKLHAWSASYCSPMVLHTQHAVSAAGGENLLINILQKILSKYNLLSLII